MKKKPKLTQIEDNLREKYPEAFDLDKINKMMEEMANMPREELGKRTPGEKGTYECR